MDKRLGLAIAALALVALVLSVYRGAAVPAAQAQAQPAGRSITVVGQGKASGTPDVAHITVGVETTGASAQEAVDANRQNMTALLAKIKEMGIADKDIQTSNFSIYTEQQPVPMPAEGQVVGQAAPLYHVSNQVNLTVRDIDKLGEVLDEAVSAGANSVYGVYFEVEDTSTLEASARENAIADAKARATSLAQLSGVSVGEVLMISEVVGGPVPLMVERAVAFDAAGGTPIQPGEFEVSVSVQVTYAIQ
jgi:hypothetical protein